jgi:phosphoglycolate phosphatase
MHFLIYYNPTMKYKLVIFDFDGTLADTLPYLISVINRLAGRYRFPRIDPAQMDALRGLDARQIIKHYRLPAWKIAIAGFDYRRMMKRDLHMIPLFPGVGRLLQHLSDQGVQQAMVSSNGKNIIKGVLGSNAAHIRHYECRASLHDKSGKIRKVLRKCGVAAHEAIYIGDEIRDMHAAKKVGMAFGAVTWGYTLPEALQRQAPNMLFDSVDDLIVKITD